MYKRFLVVTYSTDIGSDNKMDYDNILKAYEEAKECTKKEEYVAIFDTVLRIAYVVFGYPETPVFSDTIRVVKSSH